jgi:hypothetical protein
MDQGTLAGAVHSGRLLKPVPADADPAAPRDVEWVSFGAGGEHVSTGEAGVQASSEDAAALRAVGCLALMYV